MTDLLTNAREIVTELRTQGLNFAEIGRLCNLAPAALQLVKRIEAGEAVRVTQATHDKLADGYGRYLEGDRSYLRPRGTRPAVIPATEALPATPRHPVLRMQGSRLWDRVVAKRKEAA